MNYWDNFHDMTSGLADATIMPIIIALGILVFLLLATALYIYFALAWSTIAKKLKYKRPWIAWIPFANGAMILQIGGFHWAWIFLLLIPILGWIALLILLVIAHWRIFEKRKYPGWFGLSLVIPQIGGIIYLIVIGFVAWKDKGRIAKVKRAVRKAVRKKVSRRKR
ncbi:MAG: hypothetical protein KKD94_03535 [Nanoarchaeota archaeon]|nr:hypothetical protein [Nanoarchaeota archaeon]